MNSISWGFLPHKPGQRRRQLEEVKEIPGTLVLYESPHRIVKLLAELAEVYPESKVVLARELTKKFEEFKSGRPAELLAEMGKQHGARGVCGAGGEGGGEGK